MSDEYDYSPADDSYDVYSDFGTKYADDLSLDDVFLIVKDTSGLQGSDVWSSDPQTPPNIPLGPTDNSSYNGPRGNVGSASPNANGSATGDDDSITTGNNDNGPRGNVGSASPNANGSRQPTDGGVLGSLETFLKDNKNTIGLGAGVLGYWGKAIADNRDAAQKADAAEIQRQQKEQEKRDAIALAQTKYDTDWARQQAAQEKQWAHDAAVAEQRQKDQLAIIAAQNAGRSSGGGGGGGSHDPAADRAARVSASIVGMKAPTGIVNSNLFGNALSQLQRK